MAPSTALTLIRPSRAVPGGRGPSERLNGSRGIPTRVVLEVNDALAPCLEGIALCDELVAGVARITAAAMAGSRMATTNEAHRLGFRALRYRAEFQALARAIEDPEGGTAA